MSVQSSDAGVRSIRPMNVKTLNGLTFSILEAYGCTIIASDVYGRVIKLATAFCTLVEELWFHSNATLVV